MHMYIYTYIHTYICTYVRACIRTCVHTYVGLRFTRDFNFLSARPERIKGDIVLPFEVNNKTHLFSCWSQ